MLERVIYLRQSIAHKRLISLSSTGAVTLSFWAAPAAWTSQTTRPHSTARCSIPSTSLPPTTQPSTIPERRVTNLWAFYDAVDCSHRQQSAVTLSRLRVNKAMQADSSARTTAHRAGRAGLSHALFAS